MHNVATTFIGLILSGTTGVLAAQPAELYDTLLAEPLWLLFDGDGPPRPVWFENERGSLRMVTCTGSSRCTRGAVTVGQQLRLEGLENPIPVWPAPARDPMAIVPAWVVPASSGRTGH